MPSRRELLKYFGIGAVISPVVGGEVISELKATVIETPNVELVSPSEVPTQGRLPLHGAVATLTFKGVGYQDLISYPVMLLAAELENHPAEVRSIHSRRAEFIPGLTQAMFWCISTGAPTVKSAVSR